MLFSRGIVACRVTCRPIGMNSNVSSFWAIGTRGQTHQPCDSKPHEQRSTSKSMFSTMAAEGEESITAQVQAFPRTAET